MKGYKYKRFESDYIFKLIRLILYKWKIIF